MKKIETIIRKSKFKAVQEALHLVGVNFFSYWDVTGIGNENRIGIPCVSTALATSKEDTFYCCK